MDRSQATELFTLITTVRHVREMESKKGPYASNYESPGCLLCEGYRHGLYSQSKASLLSTHPGFDNHFGCTKKEALNLIFEAPKVTGENYFEAGKELLIKYGYSDFFEDNGKSLSFPDIMAELKGETVIWKGVEVPVTGVIS